MHRLLSSVFALAFAAFCLVAAPAVAAGKTGYKNPPSTNVRQVFLQRNARTMEILESDFPYDYEDVMRSIETLRASKTDIDSKLLALFSQLTQIRKKYAERLRFAPVAQHRLMIAALGRFMAEVQLKAGPAICGHFAQDGSGALFAEGVAARFASLIDIQSAAYFAAVVGAIESPEPRDAVDDEDWRAVFSRMVADGHPPAFVGTIARSDAADPTLCPALAAMLSSAARMDGAAAERFRADFAGNVTGY